MDTDGCLVNKYVVTSCCGSGFVLDVKVTAAS